MQPLKLLVLDRTEDLSVQVERVAATLRPRPSVVWCDSFQAVESLAADAGPFNLLIAGPLVSKADGLGELRDLRARTPRMQLVLALDHWRGTRLRDTVRTGALDILRLPISDDDLLEAIERAVEADPRSGHNERGRSRL